MNGRESKRTPSLTIAALLVLAALVASGVASYRATARVIVNERLVAHTLRVIAELHTTLALLTDAETGQRGYLLTRDAAYLLPYNRALADISGHLDSLSSLTANSPTQHQRVVQVRSSIAERLEISRQTVQLEEQGDHAAAMRILRSTEGKEKMDQTRGLFDEMFKEEDRQLEGRSADSEESARHARVTFTLAALAAVILVMAFYLVARREVRKRAEAAREIAEREAWLNTTLRSIGDAVIATDEHGMVKFLNAAAEHLSGFSSWEAMGRPVGEIFQVQDEATHGPIPNPVEEVIRLGRFAGPANHAIMLDRGGREIPVEENAAPIVGKAKKILGVVLVFRDVTQRRRMQESARKSEKLAAAGRLAATIAHEINNPLEAVTNLMYLARTSDSLGVAQNYLAAAEQELSRVVHITRQTLGFYRDSVEPVTLKVSSVLDEVLAVYAGRIAGKKITVERDYRDDAAIKTLRGELLQILSNLIANALDALPAGGRIRLQTAARDGGVEFRVEDNGVGIPPENLDRIFEAFFTTKTDVGTGLGLWVVRDLLGKQGGTISVESRCLGEDRGTRFIVFVPSMETPKAEDLSKAS